MIKVTYRLKLGQDEFELTADVKDEKEFFETMSFYSSLPKTAPGGSTDLKIAFRTTKENHKYYSLVSEKEKLEFKFGQNKEAQGGGLFPKGWNPLYEGSNSEQAETQSAVAAPVVAAAKVATTQKSAPLIGAQVQQAQTQVAAAPTPQVQVTANNVLARFGIPNQK